MKEIVCGKHRISGEIVFPHPALGDGHEIAGTPLVGGLQLVWAFGPCLEFILKDGIARPAVGIGLDNHPVGGRGGNSRGHSRRDHQSSEYSHIFENKFYKKTDRKLFTRQQQPGRLTKLQNSVGIFNKNEGCARFGAQPLT